MLFLLATFFICVFVALYAGKAGFVWFACLQAVNVEDERPFAGRTPGGQKRELYAGGITRQRAMRKRIMKRTGKKKKGQSFLRRDIRSPPDKPAGQGFVSCLVRAGGGAPFGLLSKGRRVFSGPALHEAGMKAQTGQSGHVDSANQLGGAGQHHRWQ